MGRPSRDKGKRGERELASALRGQGFAARRSQQYCGSAGDADVTGMPGLHIECKRTERLELYAAMAQAIGDAAPGEVPVVMHRRNNCGWLAVMRLEDFCALYRECGQL